MPRYAAIGLVVLAAGCLKPKSNECSDGSMSWVCPETLACADPPTYCANPLEVGACDGKPDAAPCRTNIVPDGICVDNACQMCSADIEGCRAVGWNPMTVPSDTYTAVYAAGSGDAWAGGSGLDHYDGAHWVPDATFPMLTTGGAVIAITGTSSAHLFVATNGTAVYHQTGGAWVSAATAVALHGVWADGDDTAFAVGLTGDVERFANGAWAQMPNTMTAKTLRAVWGTSGSDVYAVGDAGTVIHYNGTTWTASAAGTGQLLAVWGSGPNDIYVGGAIGVYHATDGATWTLQGPETMVQSIWGSSATDVFAGTTSTTNGIWHSDGSGLWVQLVSPAPATSIAGSGPTDVFTASTSQIAHYTGSCWSVVAQPTATTGLAGVAATSANIAFAVGAAGALNRFDGSAWTLAGDGTGSWAGIWARSPSDAFAVGGGNATTQIDHWDGASWTMQVNSSGDSVVGVAGNATAAYAIGNGLLVDGSGTWSSVLAAPLTQQNAIWVAPDGSVFVAGDQLYELQGNAVSPLAGSTTSNSTNWKAIWGTSASDVFAAAPGGQIRHYDGTSWSAPMDVPTTANLAGLWGTSDDDVFAVGAAGTILHYHEQLWTVVPPPAGVTTSFAAVSGIGSTIFVVGDSTVVRLIESAP